MHTPTIGIVIPTFQGEKHLPHCLPPLIRSSLNPRILIVDSSSTDRTLAIAESMGVETMLIPQSEFNHGLTREMGREYLNCDITVLITQDAYATSPEMLEKLVMPLIEGEASVSYARQLPHHGAEFFAVFARHFNYPPESQIRSIQDVPQFGAYTFFCSNSCAAYLNSALDEIGGFPHVLFGEDTIAVAKLLNRGHRIAYVADAEVRHSHDYTFRQEFSRHFDMGLAREMNKSILEVAGSTHQRGMAYLKRFLYATVQVNPLLVPKALWYSFVKLLGFEIGRRSLNASNRFKRILSSQKNFWSEHS